MTRMRGLKYNPDNTTASADQYFHNCATSCMLQVASPDYVSGVELDGTTRQISCSIKNNRCFKRSDNNELGSANVNLVVTINEHFLKQTAGI